MKISLDSTGFKRGRFIAWLINKKEEFTIYIPSIVYLETLLWYKYLSLSKDDFDNILSMMDAIYTDITQELADKVTTNAKKYKNRLPFKHHARDYIIGTTAQVNDSVLFHSRYAPNN